MRLETIPSTGIAQAFSYTPDNAGAQPALAELSARAHRGRAVDEFDFADRLHLRRRVGAIHRAAFETSVLSRKAQRKRQGFPALLPYTRFDASPRIRFLPMPGRQYGNCRQERILTIASYDSGNRIHNAIQISGFGPQLGGCRDLTSSPPLRLVNAHFR